MLDEINRVIANTIYLVPLQVQHFKAKEPHATILAVGATKAQKRDRDTELQYEARWVTARRAALILTTDKLVCGSWEILLSSIENAQLIRFKSGFAKGLVLKVTTSGGSHFQFGLQYDPAWENQTVLKFVAGDGKLEFAPLKYSKFSIALRVIVWLVAIYACYVGMILPILSTIFSKSR